MDILLATIILWLLFIPTANIVNRHKENNYTGLRKYLGYVWVLFFVVVDVIYNYTYGAILFFEFADNDRKTLTARLKHYLRTEPETWRGKLAYLMCAYMIEPWDMGHCGIKL